MKNYEDLAEFIIQHVGGKSNIELVTHCMTRLRFTLKDTTIVDEAALLEYEGIATAQYSGGKYQIVIGTHVGEVCDEVMTQLGGSNLKDDVKGEKESVLNRFIAIITQVITPVLGVLIASGLIQGLLAILSVTNIVQPNDGAYIMMNAMGQALFTFFPVVLGYTSAKAFKMDGFVGMVIGACLIFPNILVDMSANDALYTIFSGTIFATPVFKTFFGIPIIFPMMGYASSVIPIILSMFFTSKMEHFLKKHIPNSIGFTLIPFFTILIAVPLTILLIGPLANMISSIISAGVTYLYGASSVVTVVVVGLIYQPLVIFGLHWPLIMIGINNLGTTGYDFILPMIFTASFAQTAVVFAIYLRTHSTKMKNICIPAMISGMFCIIEPAIYGVTLPVKKRFLFSCIGATVGGIVLSILAIPMYAASVGVLGLVSFVDPKGGNFQGVIIAAIACLVAMIISFCLTYFSFKSSEDLEDAKSDKEIIKINPSSKITLTSPMKGSLMELSQMQDDAFASEVLGKGIGIQPNEGRVVAPCDGMISSFFPTSHAIGITSDEGVEILIHIGKDTVQLNGEYFHKKKQQGDRVSQGELILEFDMEHIKEAGFDLETSIIITNTKQFLDVIKTNAKEINYLETLICLLSSQESSIVNQKY